MSKLFLLPYKIWSIYFFVGAGCRLPVAGAGCLGHITLIFTCLHSSIKLAHRKATAKIQNKPEIKAKPSG